jgi:hypothetical protein
MTMTPRVGELRLLAFLRIGSYFLVFNTILNFDNLDAGRKLDQR